MYREKVSFVDRLLHNTAIPRKKNRVNQIRDGISAWALMNIFAS